MDRDSKQRVNAILASVLALTFSALVLLAALAVHTRTHFPEGAAGSAGSAYDIPGRRLQVVVGAGAARSDGLAITGYVERDDKHYAVAIWRDALQASSYPFLQYRYRTQHPGPELTFTWRVAGDAGRVHNSPLPRTPDGDGVLRLAGFPGWEGTIVEVGITAAAKAADEELSITGLSLQPASWSNSLRSLLSTWTGFRGWEQTSINFLMGTARGWDLSPLPVAAAWGVLAALVLAGAARVVRLHGPLAWGVVILAPWVAVDLLWQHELSTQLEETRQLFAGKTMHEKHLADNDASLYSYTRRLKTSVLPGEPARIVIAHDSSGHNFERLKAQYYLLPHNVYNFGKGPRRSAFRKGDYILVLGDTADPALDKQRRQLVWNSGKTLPVRLVDRDPRGRLYQVKPRFREQGGSP
ncbi:MAG: hypothetical protein U5K56_20045 [Halioglobus sp.]|nr:hypothetical protein [Halioglobus sp.]